MERSNLTRWLLIGVAVFLFLQFGLPLITGTSSKKSEFQPLAPYPDSAPSLAQRQDEQLCAIAGNRFKAELSSKGAVLKHAWMVDEKYRVKNKSGELVPIDLVTTTIIPRGGTPGASGKKRRPSKDKASEKKGADNKGAAKKDDEKAVAKKDDDEKAVAKKDDDEKAVAKKDEDKGDDDEGDDDKGAAKKDGSDKVAKADKPESEDDEGEPPTLGSERMPLRTDLRTATNEVNQLNFSDFDWKLASKTSRSCTFKYADDKVELTKVIAATEMPFELSMTLTVTNKSKKSLKHRLTAEQADWRTVEKTKGSWGSLSEFLTEVVARTADETYRFEPGDFEPDDFGDEDFTPEKWRRTPKAVKVIAVSSSYFSKALIPLKGPSKPAGEMLIEEVWNHHQYPDKTKDPLHGHIYRARLNYGEKKLAPGETVKYELLAYNGPKERELLSSLGGGGHEATELLDLGVFGSIGKVLIQYLYILYGLVGTWGWAICLLTITVKLLLFPLSIAQIKSTMAMRKLKPEMDVINEKYKDDAQQKGLAMQELWRKNKVANPMLGCLPLLLQMPVWFALYPALRTAVELYHTPFGPFIPDLSAPGLYYIIPITLGLSSFLQQHLMPMQGDARQQKMMKYMMPGVFTVMMLFLPAGLGIYFLTNTWLGILQQLGVERIYKARDARREAEAPAQDEPSDSKKNDPKKFGKGKTRVQQRG